MSVAKDPGPPAALPLDADALEAVAKALVKSCQGGCGDWRRHTADAQRAITAYLAALPAPPGDLVGALRECRAALMNWTGRSEKETTCRDAAITRADAALASAEQRTGTPDE